MPLVYIKIDTVAYMRNIWHSSNPDPSHAAFLAEMGGADGVCCYLREDLLYVKERDLYILKETVKNGFDIQLSPERKFLEIAFELKPEYVTLMPALSDSNNPDERKLTENDLDLYSQGVTVLQDADVKVSYFIEPSEVSVKNAARIKADAVELSAADYVMAKKPDDIDSELDRLEQMGQLAKKLGMEAHCSSGLSYRNIKPILELEVFDKITVGHSVTTRALLVGYERAVRELIDIVNGH